MTQPTDSERERVEERSFLGEYACYCNTASRTKEDKIAWLFKQWQTESSSLQMEVERLLAAEHVHYPACNASRKVPIGTKGVGCICVVTCKHRMNELETTERRCGELEAARIAYANEFPPTSEGEPDIGSIHQNIRSLKKRCVELEKALQELREHPGVATHPRGIIDVALRGDGVKE